jgi:hypothetical protein
MTRAAKLCGGIDCVASARQQASAHALAQRYDLPLPLAIFSQRRGSGRCSFAILALFWRHAEQPDQLIIRSRAYSHPDHRNFAILFVSAGTGVWPACSAISARSRTSHRCRLGDLRLVWFFGIEAIYGRSLTLSDFSS